MGFFLCKLEPDICMLQNGIIYEYIDVYVDDSAIMASNPKTLVDTLLNMYKFKLKLTVPITFHLGLYLFHDSNGVLWFTPLKYNHRIFQAYMNMFGSNPILNKYLRFPLEHGGHQDVDTLEFLYNNYTHKY